MTPRKDPNMSARPTVGYVAIVGYIATIPLANWFIGNIGAQAAPGAPHTIPVGFGLDAPSGVLWIGVALVLRDYVQATLGRRWVLGAIAVGAALSAVVADPALAAASAAAFTLGELADFAVYTPLVRRNMYAAVVASGAVGAFIDSAVFLAVAFGAADVRTFVVGLTLGKVWMSVAALPVIYAARHHRRPTGATA